MSIDTAVKRLTFAPQRKIIAPQIREVETVSLETVAARYVDAFRLLTMEHIEPSGELNVVNQKLRYREKT